MVLLCNIRCTSKQFSLVDYQVNVLKKELQIMQLDLVQFIYKAAASAAVGGLIAMLLWPFRKIRKEWLGLKESVASVHSELSTQRENCLNTLQQQGETQIELLGKTVAALDGVRLDLAEQTGYLRASATPVRPARRKK